MLWPRNDFWSDVDRLLELVDYARQRTEPAKGPEGLRRDAMGPRVSFEDEGARFVVRAELPGFGEDDVKVTLNEQVLTLDGERRIEPPEGYSVHRRERWPFRFSRSMNLPAKVDPEKTVARIRNGILTLEIPKTPEAQPRAITIRGE